jgi:glycerol kinase
MSKDTKFDVTEIYVDGGASEDNYLVCILAEHG